MSLTIPSPTGTTRLFAHIGDPIAQVQAPMLMNRVFLDAAVDAVMVAVQAKPDAMGRVVEGLKCIGNLGGILVTIPHKFAICAHADRRSVTVALAGSANALRREADGTWFAENFDGLGFVEGLRVQGHQPRGMRVVLVGAGGAGVAIAAALVQAGIQNLMVIDAIKDKADDLASRLNAYRLGVATTACMSALGDADLAINATPLGLRPEDPPPFAIDHLRRNTIVADIIMKPQETVLLKAAAQRGLRTHAGIHMLTPQVQMYRGFFGI
jgi:shikimate dehydrogenase